MKQLKSVIPGFFVATVIAFLAIGIEWLLPGHYIGAAVLAMFIGIAVRTLYFNEVFNEGVQFTSKKLLKFAIILLGASLNFSIILNVGGRTLLVLLFTLLTAFGGGFLLSRLFKVNWKLGNMIAAGTAICGGSAIAAMAPVIEADDGDVSYAISSTFVFDMLMVVAYPIVGQLLRLSDSFFGFWAGTSINDTSSVVAASFAFSDAAGEIATMVKLTRTLAIIPTVIIFSIVYYRSKVAQGTRKQGRLSLRGLIPWFIIVFVVLAGLNSVGIISPVVSGFLRSISRFLMVISLAAIGLKTDLKLFMRTGWKPFVLSMVLSTLVVLVSFGVVYVVIG